VLEYMASRGAPVDSMIWGTPLINIAVGNASIPVVECLVRCGADLDLRGSHPDWSAREAARWMFEQDPSDVERRRIVELCGLDPDAIVAERDARPVGPPSTHPGVERSLELAGNDAFRLGQPDIRPENVFFGVLRAAGLDVLPLSGVSRADLERYGAEVGERVRAIEEHVERPKLPMHPDTQAAIQWMLAHAAQHRRTFLTVYNLLHALTRDDRGFAAELLARYGVSAAKLNAELGRAL
jgi:hypothetical protein